MVQQDASRPAGRAESLADGNLDLPATDPDRYAWEPVDPADRDFIPGPQRLLHVVADRMRWLQAIDQARRRARGLQPDDLSATGRAA